MRFNGKIALVAGGTGGLGRAVSLALLNEGAEVIVTYRNAREKDELMSAAAAHQSNLSAHNLDVTDEAAVQRLVDGILAEKGHLDVLVNTVGGYAGGTTLWETEIGALEHLLALNLRAGFLLSRAAAKAMLGRSPQTAGQRSGAIVNVAATAAFDHRPGLGAYAASKAAAVAMIDSLAADLKGSGVRVNSVLPSIIDTEANRKAMPDADFAAWPKPEDIARVILFLCSDEARVVHGASVPVSGNA